MYEFDEEEGLNLFDLIKVAFGINKFKRLLFCIITVVLTVILSVVLLFCVSKPKQYYSTSFNYDIEALKDDKYLDGSSFNYNSIIGLDNLNTAKTNSNINVNVDKLYNKSGIKINYNKEEGNQYPYTVTVKTKYFNSKSDAKKFVKELVLLPITKTEELVNGIDNTSYLRSYKSASTYEDKVDNLINQANSIITQYDELISLYPNMYVTNSENSKVKLTELRNNASSAIDSLYLDTLKPEIERNYYVLNYDSVLEELKTRKSNYEMESQNIQNIITALQNEIDRQSQTTSNELNAKLAEYIIKKVEIDRNIEILDNQITYGNTVNSTSFNTKLESNYEVLLGLSNTIKTAEKEIYSTDNMHIYYSTNKIVSKQGGLNIIIIIGASLVCGLVVASVTNLVLDLNKYKKSKEEKKKAIKAE
ncbi:MAG: hypothetical protein K5892_05790 [Acholeplasmatales bacterium]|nr:hypothetical protein [Acholeplasmatales bacterium]